MDYVRLGSTGLKVSRICLGMMSYGDKAQRAWALDEPEAEPIVRRAVEGGITFFDTADVYSGGVSEQITGRLLGGLFRHRDDYVLATKVHGVMGEGPNDRGLSRKHILAGIDGSLRRLGTDHVDLYQIHRFDPETPIEETMAALHDVVQAGKARYIGASSMYAWQFASMQHAADRHGWTRFVSMQNHYNLVYREEEREMIPYCMATGVGVIPWSPLARGLLAGNRGRGGEKRTAPRAPVAARSAWHTGGASGHDRRKGTVSRGTVSRGTVSRGTVSRAGRGRGVCLRAWPGRGRSGSCGLPRSGRRAAAAVAASGRPTGRGGPATPRRYGW